MLSPRESAKFIAEMSQHVRINTSALKKVGDQIINEINSGNFSIANANCELFPQPTDDWAVDWLFVVYSINFCVWFPKTKIRINDFRGNFAIREAINKAMRNGIDILNPHFYSKITHDVLSNILRDDRKFPIRFVQKRQEIMHQMGKILIEKFNGSFKNVVIAANHSAVKLLNLLVDNFPHFNHVAYYHGKKVSFYKKAKSLIANIWICLKNEGIGYFPDIGELTGIAGYRIPQCLAFLEVLQYSHELKDKVSNKKILSDGSQMEVELCGCSIHVIELLKNYVISKIDDGKLCNSIIIDYYLFEYRQRHPTVIGRTIDFHKTISTHY